MPIVSAANAHAPRTAVLDTEGIGTHESNHRNRHRRARSARSSLPAIMEGTNPIAFLNIPALLLIIAGGTAGRDHGLDELRDVHDRCRRPPIMAFKGSAIDVRAAPSAAWSSSPRRRAATACSRSRRTSPRSTTPTPEGPPARRRRHRLRPRRATILESEVDGHGRSATSRCAELFATAGGFAPTLGILGTVMGLDPRAREPRRAVHARPRASRARSSPRSTACRARTSLPADRQQAQGDVGREVNHRTMVLEAILSIQAGDNPRVLAEKLEASSPPAKRGKQSAESGAPAAPRRPRERQARMSGSRRRRRRTDGGGGHEGGDERWLLTYADMITLLMAPVHGAVVDLVGEHLQVPGAPARRCRRRSSAGARRRQGRPCRASPTRIQGVQTATAEPAVGLELRASSRTRLDPIAQAEQRGRERRRAAGAEPRARSSSRSRPTPARTGFVAASRRTIDQRGLVIRLLTDKVLFDSGQAVLKPTAAAARPSRAADRARRGITNPIARRGQHRQRADLRRRVPVNWELSTARATAVLEFMFHRRRPAQQPLSVAGYADQNPIAPNTTAARPRAQPARRRGRDPQRPRPRRSDPVMKSKLKIILPVPAARPSAAAGPTSSCSRLRPRKAAPPKVVGDAVPAVAGVRRQPDRRALRQGDRRAAARSGRRCPAGGDGRRRRDADARTRSCASIVTERPHRHRHRRPDRPHPRATRCARRSSRICRRRPMIRLRASCSPTWSCSRRRHPADETRSEHRRARVGAERR